jgi:hypothetical protein
LRVTSRGLGDVYKRQGRGTHSLCWKSRFQAIQQLYILPSVKKAIAVHSSVTLGTTRGSAGVVWYNHDL